MLDVLKFKSAMAEGVLDAGDDTILIQEDRFKQFMNSMETVVDQPSQPVDLMEDEDIPLQNLEKRYREKPDGDKPEAKQASQLPVFDTDLPEEPLSTPSKAIADKESQPAAPDWLNQLAQVFENPAQTQALVESLTEKDEATGKTYFKLPVENEAVVENMLKGIGQLFQAIDWDKVGKN